MTAAGHTPETVLVTGGGGFLGSAIVAALVARGDRVRSFSRHPHPALDKMRVEHVLGDITDLPTLERACRGVDAVFHTAAKPPPWGAYRDYCPHEHHGHVERDRRLPPQRRIATDPHQHPQCDLRRPRPGRGG